jgi:hypothetical protein
MGIINFELARIEPTVFLHSTKPVWRWIAVVFVPSKVMKTQEIGGSFPDVSLFGS